MTHFKVDLPVADAPVIIGNSVAYNLDVAFISIIILIIIVVVIIHPQLRLDAKSSKLGLKRLQT